MLQLKCFCTFLSLFLPCCSLLMLLRIVREKSFIFKIICEIHLPSQEPFSATEFAPKQKQGNICLCPMEWYIHISAENGADLILIEKGVWILGSFLQCPTFRTEAELCLGQKSTCPFTPNNLLRIGSTWDQPGTGLDAESANHTQRLSPPCCGM